MDLIGVGDVRDKLRMYIKSGGPERFYIGHKSLDKHYGIRQGSRTDWSGYPASGKTELMLECLWNCSQYYDHKHLINMPDAGSNEEIIAKLFHKVTGKRMEKYYWTSEGRQETDNLATVQELDRHLPEILEYFKILKTKEPISPTQFWLEAEKMQTENKIFSAVIDSWNHMYHDTDGQREDKWLAQTLQVGNDIVERSGLHFHTIIHPKSAKIKDGKLQPPTYHELKGGSEWGNYAKSVIIVHREKNENHSEIHIEKAKGANIGVKGMIVLHFDIKTGKYFHYERESNQSIRHYAQPEGTEEPQMEISAIQPMENFYEVDRDNDETPF
jgi:hypothetical protein